MPTGLASAICDSFLSALFQQTNYTAPTAAWAKLHVGEPGADGTGNPATETTRVECTDSFGTAAASAAISNTVLIGPWTDVAAAEDYSHISIWDGETAGNFLFSGAITANAVAVGDSFDIPIGDFDSSFTPASDPA